MLLQGLLIQRLIVCKYKETFCRVVKNTLTDNMHLIKAEHLVQRKFLVHSSVILHQLLCETWVREKPSRFKNKHPGKTAQHFVIFIGLDSLLFDCIDNRSLESEIYVSALLLSHLDKVRSQDFDSLLFLFLFFSTFLRLHLNVFTNSNLLIS